MGRQLPLLWVQQSGAELNTALGGPFVSRMTVLLNPTRVPGNTRSRLLITEHQPHLGIAGLLEES